MLFTKTGNRQQVPGRPIRMRTLGLLAAVLVIGATLSACRPAAAGQQAPGGSGSSGAASAPAPGPAPNGPASRPSAEPPPPPGPGEPTVRHVRKVGQNDLRSQVVVRFGDLLEVAPAGRPGGWRVADYPTDVLRLQGTADPADSHTFLAVAIGVGQVTLTPARGAGDPFTVQVRVQRDLMVPPLP